MTTTMLQGPVTFTATVSSGANAPTGNINFMDGGTLLATAPVSNGTASLTTLALTAGTHGVTVAYGGDTNYLAVTSNPGPETVLDFSLKPILPADGSQTVLPGGSTSYQVSITPTIGTDFPVEAVLSICGLPQGATAMLITKSWTQLTATSWQVPSSTSLRSVSLSIHVPGQALNSQTTREPGDPFPPVAWGLVLLPFVYRLAGNRLAARRAVLLISATVSVAIMGLSGCGMSGFFGQAPQTNTVTLTVTAGPVSHSTDLTLKVQ